MKCKNYLRNGYGQFCKCYLGVLGVWSGTYGDVWLGNGRNLSWNWLIFGWSAINGSKYDFYGGGRDFCSWCVDKAADGQSTKMGLCSSFNYPPEAVKSGKTRLYKISIYYTLIWKIRLFSAIIVLKNTICCGYTVNIHTIKSVNEIEKVATLKVSNMRYYTWGRGRYLPSPVSNLTKKSYCPHSRVWYPIRTCSGNMSDAIMWFILKNHGQYIWPKKLIFQAVSSPMFPIFRWHERGNSTL